MVVRRLNEFNLYLFVVHFFCTIFWGGVIFVVVARRLNEYENKRRPRPQNEEISAKTADERNVPRHERAFDE